MLLHSFYTGPDDGPQGPQHAAYMEIHGCVKRFSNEDFLNY